MRTTFLTVTLCLASAGVVDRAAAVDGRELLHGAFDQRRIVTGRSRARMTLHERDRQWERTVLIVAKQANPHVRLHRVTFEAPADLAGSSVLTQDDAKTDVAQWVYVPAYHTVRRIPPASRGEMYLGTDYAYEDLLELRWDDHEYRIVPASPGERVKLLGVEVLPKVSVTGAVYPRRIFWVEPVRKVIVKEEFFDKSGKLTKRLVNSQLRQYGKYWLWDRSVMENLLTGHRTTTAVLEREIDKGVPDDTFTVQALKRGSAP